MKKINLVDNNGGFVIVETIIVSIFVIGICTFLFSNFLPLIGDYERISNYDDLDSKYKVHEIRKMILRDTLNDYSIGNIFTEVKTSNSKYFRYENDVTSKNNKICDKLKSKKYCNLLLGKKFLDVKEIIITPFKLSEVKQSIKEDKNISRAVKEYIDYLPKYDKYSGKDNYYRIVVVFNNGKLANVEVYYV